MLPSPAALRLVSRTGAGGKSPRPPLGLAGWTDDAPAIAVLLEAAEHVEEACAQIPDPETLAPETLVVILGLAPAPGSLLARIFAPSARTIPRFVRATALLGRGYVRIGAATCPTSGADLVWGYTPA